MKRVYESPEAEIEKFTLAEDGRFTITTSGFEEEPIGDEVDW